jgi:hypothetical protein
MPFRVIKILGGSTTTHKLRLSDGGTTTVRRNDDVKWELDGSQRDVDSFYVAKKGTTEIFVTAPPRRHAPMWEGRVKPGCPYIDYEYSIIWKDRGGVEHTHDPKLSVRPHLITAERVVLFLAAAAVTVAMCLMLKKKVPKFDSERIEQDLPDSE